MILLDSLGTFNLNHVNSGGKAHTYSEYIAHHAFSHTANEK